MQQQRFINILHQFCLITLAALCGCASKPQEVSSETLSHAGVRVWEGRSFDRVVGYRFADSSEWRAVLRMDLNQLDMAYLQKMKRNETALSEAQIDQTLDAIFGAHAAPDPAWCYEPHHIFIFFSKDQPVGAFEFCLQCQQYRAWPRRNLGVNESYLKLAALCRELGLGVKPPRR